MTLRIVLEGGESDLERDELQLVRPPAHVQRGTERYGQVLSHFDEHLRDITGCWRYRLEVAFQKTRPTHSAISVKP